MKHNSIQSKEEKKALKRENDVSEKRLQHEHICTIINQPDKNGDLDYDDIVDIINEKNDNQSNVYNIMPISDTNDVIFALKNIASLMQNKKHTEKNTESDLINVNDINSELNFCFLNRKSSKNIFLTAIKTRLEWQNGEFPFFKTDVRYFNQETIPYKNKRRHNRHIKSFSVQNIVTGHYHDLPYPVDVWPCKGLLYVTNLRLFFKKTKHDSFYICFDNILNYHFYENSIVVEHLKFNQKLIDVFYVDPEQARLLETIIHVTL